MEMMCGLACANCDMIKKDLRKHKFSYVLEGKYFFLFFIKNHHSVIFQNVKNNLFTIAVFIKLQNIHNVLNLYLQ